MPRFSPEHDLQLPKEEFIFPEFIDDEDYNHLRIHHAEILADDLQGYIVRTDNSCRLLAVLEVVSDDTHIFADLFRVKIPLEGEDIDQTACFEQMWYEVADKEVSPPQLIDLLKSLKFGKGMAPQYPSVISECNTPEQIYAWSDAYRDASFFPDNQIGYEAAEPLNSPLEIIEATFADDNSPTATMLTDIARHMSELPLTLRDGRYEFNIYRSRFANYALPDSGESHPINDIALIRVMPIDSWYATPVSQKLEVDESNVWHFLTYEHSILEFEIPDFILGAIRRRLHLVDNPAEQAAIQTDLTQIPEEINAYKLLEESA